MNDLHEQQLEAARAAAVNIRGCIHDVQLFVLQPSNRAADKAAALAATLRIERLTGAVIKACDGEFAAASIDVAKAEWAAA